ncbi:probable transcriptional regulator [Pseudomonas aeruginosa NCMG1179]|nr:probable transcriptional regulator [Pseudomonas aeruginosa NCMG1179]
MARKTKEESQKTRDGILDAAERVFLEKGVGTTAMADLADAAGVSRGAVYGPTATTRTRSRSAWRCATAPSARSRYPTKTPGCRRWISSCAPAWAFSASAASPVRCSGCWRSSTSSANAATRTSRCCAAASCSRGRGNASASGRSAGRWSAANCRRGWTSSWPASICNRSGTASAAPWPGPSACATIPGTAPNACSAPASTACAVLPTCCWRTPEGVNRPPSGACAGPRRRRPPAAGRLPR